MLTTARVISKNVGPHGRAVYRLFYDCGNGEGTWAVSPDDHVTVGAIVTIRIGNPADQFARLATAAEIEAAEKGVR